MGDEHTGVPTNIKLKVLERDEFKCQRCGYAFLEVHHIDGNRENNDLNNLITLCRKCHFEIHAIEYLAPTSYYQQEKTYIKTILSKHKVVEQIVDRILDNCIKNINININIKIAKKSKKSRSSITIEIGTDKLSIDESIQYNLCAKLRNKIIDRLKHYFKSGLIIEDIKNTVAYVIAKEIHKELELERFSIALKEKSN